MDPFKSSPPSSSHSTKNNSKQQSGKGATKNLRKYFKYLPWALPTLVFLFDFADLQWMFSHEPGLTGEVVRRFQLFLLPGTLFFTPGGAILFNCGLAALAGTIASFAAKGKR